jgi:nitrogen fixation-related uncharacterized protein
MKREVIIIVAVVSLAAALIVLSLFWGDLWRVDDELFE